MGLLEVNGQLPLGQFWPKGDSDGDTAHVIIESIKFTTAAGKTSNVEVFEGATIAKKEVIHTDKDGVKSFTIRLQGIDSPELHCDAPNVKKEDEKAPNHPYRQHLGEAAAKALHDELRRTFGNAASAPCRVVTNVEHPNEVFDTYGRLIGDIIVKRPDGHDLNLNHWMVQHGWAFPAFYVSMSEEEIKPFMELASVAQKAEKGIWKTYSKTVAFDPTLIHKRATDAHPGELDASDEGAVLFPKIFRRLVREYVTTGDTKTLHTYLGNVKQHDDKFIYTKDLLEVGKNSASQHDLSDVVTDKHVKFEPAGVVFLEQPSTLHDADGGKITHW